MEGNSTTLQKSLLSLCTDTTAKTSPFIRKGQDTVIDRIYSVIEKALF